MTKKPIVGFLFFSKLLYNLLWVRLMKKYCELISKSLIDFEEIKMILANNNVLLLSGYQAKERVFLKNGISLLNANYKTIIDNSLTISEVDDKKFLFYTTGEKYNKESSKIEIVNESECEEFLNHIGYKEQFVVDSDRYIYSDGNNYLYVTNLANIGLYVGVRKENANEEELKEILSSFDIPYDEEVCDESMERLFVNKLRRQMK